MSKAIADASVLINLAFLGRFALLQRLCEEVVVLPAVWREVVDEGDSQPGAEDARQARTEGWLAMAAPRNRDLVTLLSRTLDDGEAEVVALGTENRDCILLLDETEARRVADAYGLRKIGVVGILLRAREEGWLASLGEDLVKLRDEGGFWLDDALVARVLAESKEV